MDARDAALDSVSPGGSGLSGVLKITAPNVIGHSVVVPVVAELIAENPALRVDLNLSDGVIDIATAGLDVAVRVARFGEPTTIEDLMRHPCIKLHAMDHWPFTRGGEMHPVRTRGPLSASTVDAVRAACIAGVGIAMLTYWDVHEQIERGELKRIVLAEVEPLQVGIWTVFPTRTQMPGRVRAFIDALRDRLLASRDAASNVPRRGIPLEDARQNPGEARDPT
jgi:DNA-binding transcriptional LysR family regulator